MNIREKLPLITSVFMLACAMCLLAYVLVLALQPQPRSLQFTDAEARAFREKIAQGDDSVTEDTRKKLKNRDYERGYMWGAFVENWCRNPFDATIKTHLVQCALHREVTLGEPQKD